MSVDVRGAVISLEALNADIEAVCEDIVDLIDSKYDLSEKSTVHFRANFAPYLAPATLFLSPYGAHRQLDLFLTIFVRYRMCTALLKIMKPFHPAFGVRVKNKKAAVCPDLAKYIESCYDDMKASGE